MELTVSVRFINNALRALLKKLASRGLSSFAVVCSAFFIFSSPSAMTSPSFITRRKLYKLSRYFVLPTRQSVISSESHVNNSHAIFGYLQNISSGKTYTGFSGCASPTTKRANKRNITYIEPPRRRHRAVP